MRGRPLLVALALAGAACATSLPTGPEEETLLGSWTWVEAVGGIAGSRLTPASEGVERELRFLPGGSAELFEDGERVRVAAWELGEGAAGGSFPGADVVRWDTSPLGGWDEQALALSRPGTLVLADGCCDGFVWTFARDGS